MENQRNIFLNVNPLSKHTQVIHLETILKCNYAILATFKTKSTSFPAKIDEIKFEMYHMSGLSNFRFSSIKYDIVEEEGKLQKTFFINLKPIFYKEAEPYTYIPSEEGKEIILEEGENIDNTVSICINHKCFTIKPSNKLSLDDHIPSIDALYGLSLSESLQIIIPTNERPCQYKIVNNK